VRLTVQWDRQPPTTVVTTDELDTVLDAIAGVGRPVMVDLFDPERDDPWGERALIQIGVGHPDRSFVMFDADSVWAVDPDTPPSRHAIWFDYGGTPTEYSPNRTRVTPETARQAAREFLARGGQRPTCVQWLAE
jgi:hypothetical protein